MWVYLLFAWTMFAVMFVAEWTRLRVFGVSLHPVDTSSENQPESDHLLGLGTSSYLNNNYLQTGIQELKWILLALTRTCHKSEPKLHSCLFYLSISAIQIFEDGTLAPVIPLLQLGLTGSYQHGSKGGNQEESLQREQEGKERGTQLRGMNLMKSATGGFSLPLDLRSFSLSPSALWFICEFIIAQTRVSQYSGSPSWCWCRNWCWSFPGFHRGPNRPGGQASGRGSHWGSCPG